MGFKDQLKKLGDNWLIIALVIVLLVVVNGGAQIIGSGSSALYSSKMALDSGSAGGAVQSAMYQGVAPIASGNFAPDVTQRKIIKSGSLSTQIERGTFDAAEQRMKGIVASANGFLLNQNSNTYTPDNSADHASKSGWYSIKVDKTKYDSLVGQLKTIGTVQSYSESADDVTGSYTDLKTELTVETERMARYQAMYDQATLMADKITLNDQMFNEQRTIEYIQKALDNTDQQVDYSTLSFSIAEKPSDYISVVLVKFSELVRSFVNSLNSLLTLIFVIIPYAVAAGIIWALVALYRKVFRGKGRK